MIDEEQKAKLKRRENGVYHIHMYNIYYVLSHHADWKGVFGINEKKEVSYKLSPPYVRDSDGPLNDSDYMRIKLFISAFLGGTPGTKTTIEAVRMVAEDVGGVINDHS